MRRSRLIRCCWLRQSKMQGWCMSIRSTWMERPTSRRSFHCSNRLLCQVKWNPEIRSTRKTRSFLKSLHQAATFRNPYIFRSSLTEPSPASLPTITWNIGTELSTLSVMSSWSLSQPISRTSFWGEALLGILIMLSALLSTLGCRLRSWKTSRRYLARNLMWWTRWTRCSTLSFFSRSFWSS